MKRKLIALTLVGLMGVTCVGMTACGGEGEQDTATTKYITVWLHKSEAEPEGRTYRALMDEFNEADYVTEDGRDIVMRIEFKGTAETLDTAINGEILSGGLPDVVAVDAGDITAYANDELIVPIDDCVTADERADYVDSVIEQSTYEGSLYALSGMDTPGGLYYNKTALESVGYGTAEKPFGTIENPWSWKDLEEAMEALKAQNDIDGTTPYRLRANIGFGGDEGAMYLYSPVVYSAGGQFFGPNEQVTGYLSGEAAMNGLNQMNDLFARKGDYMEEGNNALAFPQGDAAFEVYGPWLINSISQEYPEFEDDYDIMPFPVYEAEDGTKGTVATPCGTWGFGVTRDADDVDAATQVIKFLTGAHASEMFFSDIGTFPTHKSVLSSMEEFTEEGPLHSLSQLLLETATPRPKMVNYPRLSVAYRDIIAFIKTQTGSQSLADYVLEKAQSVDR